uniref:Uncharacterized protein n=1 Tax=Knipowitschia caucasica TaxID=637954 RepID=A0AAV2M5X5_KNICA
MKDGEDRERGDRGDRGGFGEEMKRIHNYWRCEAHRKGRPARPQTQGQQVEACGGGPSADSHRQLNFLPV